MRQNVKPICDLAIDMAEYGGTGEKIEEYLLSPRYGIKKHIYIVKSDGEERKTGILKGRYVTLSRKTALKQDEDEKASFKKFLSDAISETIEFLSLKPNYKVLVAGLGNGYMTSDALGKKTVEKIIATRGIREGLDKVREISAVAVGVSGITGVESYEAIRGLAREIAPDLVVCVDSLCGFRTDRIGRAYQISTCGIEAGSGGGKSSGVRIDEKLLGVPVLSVGVPFVVSARRLLYDVSGGESGFDPLSPEEDMFVTPREVDAILDECSSVIASAINAALL